MSYNNNWVKTLSESYVNNGRPMNLDEQLQEQVALNEELLGLIEALCEELGVDTKELLNELSPKFMGRYIKKASRSIADLGRGEVDHLMQSRTSGEYGARMKKTARKIRNRERGIDRATDGLTGN